MDLFFLNNGLLVTNQQSPPVNSYLMLCMGAFLLLLSLLDNLYKVGGSSEFNSSISPTVFHSINSVQNITLMY